MRRMRDKWSDSLSPFFAILKGPMKIENGFSLQPLSKEAQAANQDKQLRDAAKMYESHFLGEMVKAMRKTTNQEGGLMPPNMAEKIFQEQISSIAQRPHNQAPKHINDKVAMVSADSS